MTMRMVTFILREIQLKNVFIVPIQKYDEVRQPNVIAKLYNKKNKSYATIKADFFVVSDTGQIQTLTDRIKSDIKQNVEHFSEIPVKNIEINVRDQKSSDTRVL